MIATLQPRSQRWLPLMLLALLAGCGGDDQIARTGGSGTGVGTTIGTVNGFGSVIIESEAWDVRRARVEIERTPAAGFAAAEVRLGQRVQVEYATRGNADRIVVEPEVIGRISDIDPAGAAIGFRVAGQTVRVNTDPAAGPVTMLDGTAGLAGLQAGDVVDVHGSARFDAGLGRFVILASRVERRAALPDGLVRVAGVVTAYNATERRFRLGELTVTATASTVQVPAGRALADGQRVVVWSASAPGSGAAGPTLSADFIRIVEHRSSSGRNEVAGVLGRYDASASTFEVAGVPVNARAANIVPASRSLAEGQYVIASGSFDNAGVLQAAQVRIRRGDAADNEIRLDGSITDFAGLTSFRVRDVAVNAAAVNSLPACPPAGLANGLFVEVVGRINPAAARVDAERVRCVANPVGRVVTVTGAAAAVDLAARSFTLTPAGEPARAVTWTTATFFEDISADMLAGQSVRVEAVDEGAALLALKIRRSP